METETRVFKVGDVWLCGGYHPDPKEITAIVNRWVESRYLRFGSSRYWTDAESWNKEANVRLGTVRRIFGIRCGIKRI